jgi:hypothetical protein
VPTRAAMDSGLEEWMGLSEALVILQRKFEVRSDNGFTVVGMGMIRRKHNSNTKTHSMSVAYGVCKCQTHSIWYSLGSVSTEEITCLILCLVQLGMVTAKVNDTRS